MGEQANPLERDHFLSVLLPDGQEKSTTVHGSQPVMDLLVTLCASYHLNPSDYTVEVLSPNKNNISFKPNAPIGSLEAERVVLKPRGLEEKIKRPYTPEVSVRLLINYNKSHKAVVRVNPRVPLEMLLPVVCDKCEFQVQTTILLRDSEAREPLDMSKTLNDHGLREVFAKDTAAWERFDHQQKPKTPEAVAASPAPLQDLPKKEKENTGFLSLFRRRKKKPESERAGSAPGSPGLTKQAGVSMNTPPADMPKKRRAPQPPMGASQSIPNNLSTCHLRGLQVSAESTLRSTKRRAPPPPRENSQQELQDDTEVKGTVESLNAVDERRRSNESASVNLSLSSSSSPHPSQPRSSPLRPSFAHLHEVADPYLPSFRGKDLSDARSALAKVLTSSISKGALVKRLRNSATFPKVLNGSSFTPLAQRCSHNGAACEEHESVLVSYPSSEPEWEEPGQRTGVTTFKVVPSNTQKSHDPDVTVDDPGQITGKDNPGRETSPLVRKNHTETQEDETPCPPDRSETGTPLPSPEPPPQEGQPPDRPASPSSPLDLDSQVCSGSPPPEVGDTEDQSAEEEPEVTSEGVAAAPSDCSDGELNGDADSADQVKSEDEDELLQSPTQMDLCASCTDEKEAEEEVQAQEGEKEDEDSFPSPPPPIFFDEVLEEGEEDATFSSLQSSQPQSPTSNGQTNAFSEDQQSEQCSATPEQSAAASESPERTSAALSRFAQAVALAVQKSRLQTHGKGSGPQEPRGPHSTLPSPPRSTYQYGA